MKRDHQIHTSVFACGLILLQCTLYGLGDPLSKMAYTHVKVYSLLSFRYCLALAAMWAIFGKKLIRGIRNCRLRYLVIPCSCVAGAHLFSNLALTYTQATSVGFLRSMSVAITPVLSFFIEKRRITKKELLALMVTVVGLYLLCGYGSMTGFGLGELLALGCAALSAGGVIPMKRSMKWVGPLVMTMFQTAVSAVFSILCALVSRQGLRMEGAVPSVWLSVLYLAFGCTLGGYMLQNTAVRMISAKTVSLLMCCCSVMTALFSYFLLGEKLTSIEMTGALLILAGVAAETLLSGGHGEDGGAQRS